MSSSAIVDLRYVANWDPGRVAAEAFRWPVDLPQVALRDMALRLAPKSFAEAGAPVIGPSDIDVESGAVRRRGRKYQGSVYQVGTDLRQGDVLVPRTGVGPALFVTKYLRGALVSSRFHALRPGDQALGLWLWGIVSSESGMRWRSTINSGSGLPSVDLATLLDAIFPVPPLGQLRSIAGRLQAVQATTQREEEEAVATWWQLADLRYLEWRIALATPNPAELVQGDPLADYCGEIRRGRNTRRRALDSEALGYLPVADVSMLGGKSPRRWVSPEAAPVVIAEPGDVLVALLGNYAYARVADRPLVADNHVAVLRLRNEANAPALARYLNSQAAYRVRQLFVGGSPIRSLNLTDLKRFPVPAEALITDTAPHPRPLAATLEQVLWQS